MQVAGDACRQTQDTDIPQVIVDFLTDLDKILREVAQDSLVTALAPGWENLIPNQRSSLENSFDFVDYLGQAHERLSLPTQAAAIQIR